MRIKEQETRLTLQEHDDDDDDGDDDDGDLNLTAQKQIKYNDLEREFISS